MNTSTFTRFNGSNYIPLRDDLRLTGQIKRIFDVMKGGAWHTLSEIAQITKDPEASISAQLRHLRKVRFGGHTVDRAYAGEGLFVYRLIVNPASMAELEEVN